MKNKDNTPTETVNNLNSKLSKINQFKADKAKERDENKELAEKQDTVAGKKQSENSFIKKRELVSKYIMPFIDELTGSIRIKFIESPDFPKINQNGTNKKYIKDISKIVNRDTDEFLKEKSLFTNSYAINSVEAIYMLTYFRTHYDVIINEDEFHKIMVNMSSETSGRTNEIFELIPNPENYGINIQASFDSLEKELHEYIAYLLNLDLKNKHEAIKTKCIAVWMMSSVRMWLNVIDIPFENTILDKTINHYCLIMQGKPKMGKQQFLTRLMAPFKTKVASRPFDPEDKDFKIASCENAFLFMDEITKMNKAEASIFKNTMSAATFSLRKPYGRENENINRTVAYCGTSNNYDIIRDDTGNRRILVIELTKKPVYNLPVEAYAKAWALAYTASLKKYDVTLFTDEEELLIQEMNSPFEDKSHVRIAIEDLFEACDGKDPNRLNVHINWVCGKIKEECGDLINYHQLQPSAVKTILASIGIYEKTKVRYSNEKGKEGRGYTLKLKTFKDEQVDTTSNSDEIMDNFFTN